MLKLEKIAKALEISISLRKKEPLFNKAFLHALAIALGLHFAAGLLFNVRFVKIMDNQRTLSPVLVESDASLQTDYNVVAVTDTEDVFFSRRMSAPVESQPQFLSPSYQEIPNQNTYTHPPCKWDSDSFWAVETCLHDPFFPSLSFAKSTDKPITVLVSGGLDPEHLMTDGSDQIDPSALAILPNQYYKNSYEIRIDNKTGRVFWYEAKAIGSNKELNKLGERILNEIAFKPKNEGFVTLGMAEILFSPHKDFPY
jgi:hypothetical protein